MTVHRSPEEMLRDRGSLHEDYLPGDEVPGGGKARHRGGRSTVDPTEDSIALAFAASRRNDLRFCHNAGKWYVWTGSRWQKQETRLAFHWAREMCRDINRAGDATLAKAATASAVERFAQADPAFAVTSEIWDADPLLLGTPAGTVDLRTGELRPATPEDNITKLTAVGPAATCLCRRWLQFLDETFGGDAETIRLVQQWCGYSLTGDIREHALLFGSGSGGNGKSVLLNTVTGIMKDYAVTAAMDTFTASQNDRHLTELAMLRGARLVTASETEEGRQWAEARIKQLTGGDPVTARFMRQDNFTFQPTFKLMIIGNHQPALRNVDEAMRRRLRILPFDHKPAKPDRHLEEKLKAEWPGILRWMVEGCLDWQQHGLTQAADVATATAEYFAEQDLLAQWLEEACDVEPDNTAKWATSAELFGSWSNYAKAAGEHPGTTKSFGPALKRHGIQTYRTRAARGFQGIRLKQRSAGYGDD